MRGGLGLHVVGQHVEVERQHVCRLRGRNQISGGGEVGVAECLFRLAREFGVLLGVGGLAERRGGLRHDVGRIGEETLLYEGAVGHGRVARHVVVDAVKEPVAVMPAHVPQIVDALGGHAVHPRLHALVLVLEDALVAVSHVVLPRDDGCNVGPTHVARAREPLDVGHHVGHLTVGLLVGRHVLEPFAEEVLYVAVERRCAEEHLRVARPAQTLVALGAVGGYVDEVAAQSPLYVALEPVHLLVRRGETAVLVHVREYDRGFEILGVELAFDALHFEVAESVERERRFETVLAAAANVAALRLGRTQVDGVEVAVFVEHLGMRHDYLLPLLSFECKDLAAHEVLPEVEHLFARGGGYDGHGALDLVRDDGFALAAHQIVGAVIGHLHRRPNRVVETRGVPALLTLVEVDGLAVVYLRVEYLARRRLPSAVGDYGVARAVGVGHHDLRQRAELVRGIDLVLAARPAQTAEIPPAAQHDAEGVLAAREHVGDVVGAVLQTLVIGGPPGSEVLVADLAAVEVGFVHAVRRYVGHGRRHGFLQCE